MNRLPQPNCQQTSFRTIAFIHTSFDHHIHTLSLIDLTGSTEYHTLTQNYRRDHVAQCTTIKMLRSTDTCDNWADHRLYATEMERHDFTDFCFLSGMPAEGAEELLGSLCALLGARDLGFPFFFDPAMVFTVLAGGTDNEGKRLSCLRICF